MATTLTAALKALPKEDAESASLQDFDEIIRLHQQRVYRVIYVLVRDADLADTLTQECFLRAYQNRGRFRGECRLETWLFRIAVNLVRDHAKNRRASFWKRLIGLEREGERPYSAHLTAPQPSAERALLAREALDAVWLAVDSLSAQQRTIFLLRFADEMALAEIADALDLSIGSVKAQLCRATRKIRESVRDKSW